MTSSIFFAVATVAFFDPFSSFFLSWKEVNLEPLQYMTCTASVSN